MLKMPAARETEVREQTSTMTIMAELLSPIIDILAKL
jgi:hypothetical protein